MYLTNQPISIELQQVLVNLENGIPVDIIDIENTKEMLLASSIINRSIPTNLIKNREDLQYSIMQKSLNNKAAEMSSIFENVPKKFKHKHQKSGAEL